MSYNTENLTQAQIFALQSCSNQITSKLEESNITSEIYVLSGSACRVGTDSKSLEECNAELADLPHFTFEFSIRNKTSFRTFYEYDAILEGDANYLKQCDIARVI